MTNDNGSMSTPSPTSGATPPTVDGFLKGDSDVTYQRFDLFPQLSSQLSPVPWLDVSASLGARDTYYTKSQRGE